MKFSSVLFLVSIFGNIDISVSNLYPIALCKDSLNVEVGEIFDVNDGSYDPDGDTITLDQVPIQLSCDDIGYPNDVELFVYDNNGQNGYCRSTVYVHDTTIPSASCKNVEVDVLSSGPTSIVADDIDNGSTDNCGIISKQLSKSTFDCSNIGNNPVTLSVVDNSNNVGTCNANVIVRDNPPTPLCKNIIIDSGTTTIVPDDIDNGSTDNCGIVSKTLSKDTFYCSDVGPNQVSLTVKDAQNNDSTCHADVTVRHDTIKPSAVCKNKVVYVNTDGPKSIGVNDIDNGSTDNCEIVSKQLSKYNFGCADLGDNLVTLTVKDAQNNEGTCDATVTVKKDPYAYSPPLCGMWLFPCNAC